MDANSKNLELWNMVEKTNPKYTKKVSYGKRSFTTIDAYYQIKLATSIWGSYGSTWGFRDIKITISNELGMCIFEANFFYPNGEFPIVNAIKINDDEFLKKVYTDSLTKSLSYLGFNSDVFLGFFDDSRYVEKVRREFEEQPQPQQQQPQLEPTPEPEVAKDNAKPETNKSDDVDVLRKSDIIVEEKDGYWVATGGGTYPNRNLLRNLGFTFNKEKKAWIKKIA